MDDSAPGPTAAKCARSLVHISTGTQSLEEGAALRNRRKEIELRLPGTVRGREGKHGSKQIPTAKLPFFPFSKIRNLSVFID